MSLTELLSLKADLELALGPLSSNYFDTLAIVLDEGSHAESAAAIEQLQTFVAGSADLAALHNAFIKHLAATQAEQVDPTADEQAVAVRPPGFEAEPAGPSYHFDAQDDTNLFELSPEALRNHIIASHQAAAAPFEEQGLSHSINLIAAREGLAGVESTIPGLLETAVHTMIKNTLQSCLLVKGRHTTQKASMHYRFRGQLTRITPFWLHTAMTCRGSIFKDLLLAHREAAAIMCDEPPQLPWDRADGDDNTMPDATANASSMSDTKQPP
eukprot:TRINITY_DN10572_c0_g2_i4.p1 TRINITY_DN10572_c0_g2~~TRINITY_DN10572_c0_g2_i4.p1  ORF type:complete len:270 (+),score=46.02 TRINITY_DN10572_c0_g2_i4:123-932(+)